VKFVTKTHRLAALIAAFGPLFFPALNLSAAGVTGPSPFTGTPADIGPNHRTWMLTSANALGQRTPNAPILEVETGMNYYDPAKGWMLSSPGFELTNGAFVASRVQHRIRLNGDLNAQGAVSVTTPDGLLVQSTPVAIVLYDPVDGSSSIVGTITNTAGVQTGEKEVTFENAFSGVCADVVFSVEKASFSQDIVFTGRIDPADWGFPADHPMRIEIWTELYQMPQPDVIKQPLYIEQNAAIRRQMADPDMLDETIGFGEFVLGHGAAYTVPSPLNPGGVAGLVAKQLLQTPDGRVFLVESVAYSTIAKGLQSLADCLPREGGANVIRKQSRQRLLAAIPSPAPATRARAASPPPSTRVARIASKTPCVVVDYVATIGGGVYSTTTFQSSTNWFINGAAIYNGQVTIEGGTVFKFQTNASIKINSTLICKGSSYRPIIFSGVDDDTVGDSLAGVPGSYYTGNINPNGYANPAIFMGANSLTLSNCCFRYAQQAIRYLNLGSSATLNLSHSQLVKCIRGIELDTSGSGSGCCGTLTINLNNDLIVSVQNPVMISSFPFTMNFNLVNCTVDQATRVVGGTLLGSPYVVSTNSVFANITNSSVSGVTFNSCSYNGFYNSAQTFGTAQTAATNSPFQTVGASTHYLASTSNFRHAGTTNRIALGLLLDLGQRTTYPPLVYARVAINTNLTLQPQAVRDTGGSNLDLGYHFDPIDYAFGNVTLTNATMSVYGGSVLAGFNTNASAYALGIDAGGQFLCTGLASNRNWFVRYNTVQEQANTNWSGLPAAVSLAADLDSGSPAPAANFRFTDFSTLSLDGYHAYAFTNNPATLPVNFQDCQFHGGKIASAFPAFNFTNNLFERVSVVLTNKDLNVPYIRNNLFWNGSLAIYLKGSTNAVIRENLFDGTSITDSGNTYTGGYNGYVTNANRLAVSDSTDVILTNSPAYQTGPLGTYYLPTSSPLINAGSQPADYSDLYYYCTTTNEISETNSIVDISYHYFVSSYSLLLDSDGDGLPDWWEIKYGYNPNNPDTGGTGTPDGYKFDTSGDGWTLLQNYQNGTNPNQFNTPPAPTSLTAVYRNATPTISWTASPGPVTGYLLQRYDPSTGITNSFAFPSTTLQFVDSGEQVLDDNLLYGPISYRLQGQYGVNNSAWCGWMPLVTPDPNGQSYSQPFAPAGFLIRGTQGQSYLALPAMPTNASTVRIVFANSDADTNWTVAVASFTNNLYAIPPQYMPAEPSGGTWYAEVNRGDGTMLGTVSVGYAGSQRPFYDGRQQLQQNLSFLLRAADAAVPFQFTLHSGFDFLYACSSNYASASFVDLVDDSPGDPVLDEFSPFYYNVLYRNFVFSTNDLNFDGTLDSANYDAGVGPSLPSNPVHEFQGPTNGTHIDPVLSATTYPWSFFRPYHTTNSSELSRIGVTYGPSGFTLAANKSNIFGLQYQSDQTAYNTNSGNVHTLTLNAGAATPDWNNVLYPGTVQPTLKTTNYYFGVLFTDPVPGDSVFSPTNTTPVIFAPLGKPLWLAGYAKQLILNGAQNKFGYVGQYFSQADKMDSSGNITTNRTGILSEYGEFFPTEAGQAAVITMTNWGVNESGTAVVNVISIALDGNHDGNMDITLSGPDTTSFLRPFQFWVNDDFDRSQWDSSDKTNYDDSVDGFSQANFWQRRMGWPIPADCQFLRNGVRAIPTIRDLEDYARLWVCGITTNALTNLPPGTTVTLSWGDVGNPNTNNPTIDLFQAADPSGGIGYLTNATTGASQTNALYVGRIGPGQSIQLNGSQFAGNWAGNYFIWCGVSPGSGVLSLTIARGGSNIVAQTGAYIALQDIKQMYERWSVGDIFSLSPKTTASPATEGIAQPFQYGAPDTNTPYILFVHGWNLEIWEKDRFAERAFKRLYWQGYQGRFGSFRWPTRAGFAGTLLQLFLDHSQKNNYDQSENQAWQSGNGLQNLLGTLNRNYPNHVYMLAHSMGNVVAGEALRLSGATRIVNTYVPSQAAISAHTYDTTVPNYSFFQLGVSISAKTPNIYGNWFSANNGNAAGAIVSFFNTNDYALQRSAWQVNQLFKPDQQVWVGDFNWTYAYSGSPNDPSPWNHFIKYSVSAGATNTVTFDIVNSVNNRYEVMALAAESWTTALGATPNVNHVSDVDLSGVWPTDTQNQNAPYSEHFYHSAEFRGDYWQQRGYWSQLLGSSGFQLK